MKIAYAAILCVLILLVSACAQKVNDPADVQAIKKSLDDYTKAVNEGNADGVASLWTDKAIYADNHLPVAVGREAIRSQSQAFFGLFKPVFSASVDDVKVIGDFAVARGAWTMKLAPKGNGIADINDAGSWISTLARQSDGSWKFDWCVPNSNLPFPGSTASGEDENALFQLEREWGAAAMKKDTATLDKILATEFQSNYVTNTGNKRQHLATLKSDATKIESLEIGEMKAFVLGERAIVDGMTTEKSSLAGKDTSGQYRWTDVWVKRDGKWQCVMGYATKVK